MDLLETKEAIPQFGSFKHWLIPLRLFELYYLNAENYLINTKIEYRIATFALRIGSEKVSKDKMNWHSLIDLFFAKSLSTVSQGLFLWLAVNGFAQTNWTWKSPLPSGVGMNDIAYSKSSAGTQLVAVGEMGQVLTSSDGLNWALGSTGVKNWMNAVVHSDTQFVAVGDTGCILTSPDGKTWTRRISGTTQRLFSLAWSGSQLVALGDSSTILTSSNGIDWVRQNSGGAFFCIRLPGRIRYLWLWGRQKMECPVLF